MNLARWVELVEDAYHSVGKTLTRADREMLLSDLRIEEDADSSGMFAYGVIPVPMDESMLTPRQRQVFETTVDAMTRYLFKRVVLDVPFVPIPRIQQKFARTLEENYGACSKSFLTVAKIYWTYKIEVGDLFPDNYKKLLTQALAQVESSVASVFFPTPSPYAQDPKFRKHLEEVSGLTTEQMNQLRPSPEQREAQMRLLLTLYAPEFDANEFIQDNPMLKRERKHSATPKWPGFVMVAICLAILIWVPDRGVLGKIVNYGAFVWLLICVWYLWGLYTGKTK